MGEEHVGRRCLAFLKERGGELERASVFDLHIEPSGRSKLLNDRIDQRLATAGVDDERRARDARRWLSRGRRLSVRTVLTACHEDGSGCGRRNKPREESPPS